MGAVLADIMLGLGFVHVLVNSVPRSKASLVDYCGIGSWDGGHMMFELVKMISQPVPARSGLFGETTGKTRYPAELGPRVEGG